MKDLAYFIVSADMPTDGSQKETIVTNKERSRFNPEIYFVAVLDCQGNVYEAFGSTTRGRLIANLQLKDHDSEFSFED